MHQMCGFTSSCICANSHSGICSPLKHSMVSNDSVCGQKRSWSDCVDAQADLGLRCPYIPKDTFSHGAAQLNFYLSNGNRSDSILQKNQTTLLTGCCLLSIWPFQRLGLLVTPFSPLTKLNIFANNRDPEEKSRNELLPWIFNVCQHVFDFWHTPILQQWV